MLRIASFLGHTKCVEELTKAGAILDVRDEEVSDPKWFLYFKQPNV